jgi:hypothetical protein
MTTSPAFGCGPDGCDYQVECLSVGSASFSDGFYCSGDNRDFLDPGNDSRYNMALLFAHVTDQPVSYVDSYDTLHKKFIAEVDAWEKELLETGVKHIGTVRTAGMREGEAQCQSNTLAQARSFTKALKAVVKNSDSQRELTGMRDELFNVCSHNTGGRLLEKISAFENAAGDPLTRDFAAYLRGSYQFYSNDFDKSIETMSALRKSPNTWIKEASLLVAARAWLVRAQKSWAGYDDRSQITLDDLAVAESLLKEYLEQFPQGQWYVSAKGLLRRIAWLRGDRPTYQRLLNAAIDEAINRKMPMHDYWRLINEVEQTASYQVMGEFSGDVPTDLDDRLSSMHPHVAAIGIMIFLRNPQEKYTSVLRELIGKHHQFFASTRGLQPLMMALIDKSHGRWKEAAVNAAKASDAGGVIGLSADIIQAEAMENSGNVTGAADLLSALLKKHQTSAGAVKPLAVAYVRTQIRLGTPVNITRTGSLVDADTASRSLYLLTPDQLAQAFAQNPASDRKKEIAEAWLLRLFLARRWKDFISAYDGMDKNLKSRFAAAETAVRTLTKSPEDPKALFNAGYFLKDVAGQVYGLNPPCNWSQHLSVQLKEKLSEELQKTPGYYADPLTYYTQALEKNPERELKAKVLAHAIQCFSSVYGARAECKYNKEPEIPVEQRKKWFRTLKTELKGTSWEKKIDYYY